MTVADANGIFEASRAGTTNPRPTAPMLTPADPRKLTFCLKASSSSEVAVFIVCLHVCFCMFTRCCFIISFKLEESEQLPCRQGAGQTLSLPQRRRAGKQ